MLYINKFLKGAYAILLDSYIKSIKFNNLDFLSCGLARSGCLINQEVTDD